jgi:chromosome segregation ATPase
MDEQNERRVMNEILATSSGKKTSQYFLITPKLLTDLKYNEDVRVLLTNHY